MKTKTILSSLLFIFYIYIFCIWKKNLDYIRLIRPSKDQIWSYVLQTVLDDLYFTWTQFDLNSARLNQNSINTTCSPGLGGRTIRWGWLGSLVSPRVEPHNFFFFFFYESQVRLYLTSFLIILSSTIEKKKKISNFILGASNERFLQFCIWCKRGWRMWQGTSSQINLLLLRPKNKKDILFMIKAFVDGVMWYYL